MRLKSILCSLPFGAAICILTTSVAQTTKKADPQAKTTAKQTKSVPANIDPLKTSPGSLPNMGGKDTRPTGILAPGLTVPVGSEARMSALELEIFNLKRLNDRLAKRLDEMSLKLKNMELHAEAAEMQTRLAPLQTRSDLLKKQLFELRTTYAEGHPKVIAVSNDLKEVDKQIAAILAPKPLEEKK